MEFQPKMPTLVAWKSTWRKPSKSRMPKLVGIGSIFRAYRHGLAERKLNQANTLLLSKAWNNVVTNCTSPIVGTEHAS